MIYPINFEEVVGFEPIRTAIIGRSKYHSTQQMLREWGFSTDYKTVIYRLDALDEIRNLQERMPSLLQLAGADYSEFLSVLRIENAFWEEEVWVLVLDVLQTYRKLSKGVGGRVNEFPILASTVPELEATDRVILKIQRIIDEFGKISVKASPTYAKLSQDIQRLENETRQIVRGVFKEWKALGYTAETDVSVREERLVIPVLAEHKRKVQGFVKDISATGKILYVEPAQALELNNRLKELYAELRRERERILRALTAEVSPFEIPLQQAMSSLCEVDAWIAQCNWCLSQGAERPKITDEPRISLLNAVHPILAKELQAKKQVPVPLTMQLDAARIMVVSGPNAGGKSVVLKTALLLQYMAQCGLYVTALPESRLGIFHQLAIDCGDGQSIEQGLSTFSAHLKGLKEILDHAGSRSLIGLDEIGAGTDPRFGAPIAQAVLEKLLACESRVIATTHFSQLREWGTGIHDVLQASMAYDAHALKPLYRLVTGKPGSSFALELMRKTGFDHGWIERIKLLAGQQMGKTEDLMLQLERQNHRLHQQIAEYNEKLNHSEQLISSYQQLKDKLQTKRQEFLASAREEARKLLQDTNQQIEQTIRIIKEHRADKEVTKTARVKLDQHKEKVYRDIESAMKQAKQSGLGKHHDPNLQQSVEDKHKEKQVVRSERKQAQLESQKPIAKEIEQPKPLTVGELKPGAKVKSLVTELAGEVLDTKKEKVWVAFGLIKMWVPIAELTWDKPDVGKKKQRQETGFNWVEKQASFSSVLDVRGNRLDEAINRVQHWLDEGYALGWQELQLVHGRGDGILRKGLREHLKTLNYVRSYTYQTEAAGGDGCLLITLM